MGFGIEESACPNVPQQPLGGLGQAGLVYWHRLAAQGVLPPARVLGDRQWLVRASEEVKAVYFLERGLVELSQETTDGVTRVYRMVSGPALLCADELMAELAEHETSICAVGEVRVHRIDVADFAQWVGADPRLLEEAMREVSKGSVAAARFAKAPIADTEGLLANLLLSYLESFGAQGPQGWTIQLQRSQNDFAARVGAAERSINRVLADWRERGLISKQQGRYVIHQADHLYRVAANLRERTASWKAARNG